jgi:hypothetical protein
MELSEEELDTVLSSQITTYQHIQSMSATYMTIALASISIAVGLFGSELVDISALVKGIINSSTDGKFVSETRYLLISSVFYFGAGGSLIFYSAIDFIQILVIRTPEPEKEVRNADNINIKNKSNSIKNKIKWVESNVDMLSNLLDRYSVAKNNAFFAILSIYLSVFILMFVFDGSLYTLITISFLPIGGFLLAIYSINYIFKKSSGSDSVFSINFVTDYFPNIFPLAIFLVGLLFNVWGFFSLIMELVQ